MRATAGAKRSSVRLIEDGSPVESLTVYRALVAVHMAGAVFALLGLGLSPTAIDAPFRLPTLLIACLQLATATWLMRNPEWVPRVLLGAPRVTWTVSVGLAMFAMVPATDPISPPPVTVAFAWIATAAAVGPRRLYVQFAVACTGLIGAAWLVADIATPQQPLLGAVMVSLIAMLPGSINAAWMGATGNAVAVRIRRWGLVVAREAGELTKLADCAERVRSAADRVLAAAVDGAAGDAIDEIALQTLRESALQIERDLPSVRTALSDLVATMRLPFSTVVEGDDAPLVEPSTQRVIHDAVLRQLMNVGRHAPATTVVKIRVARLRPELVQICVEDDGGGRGPVAVDEGEGTAISRSAVAACGGALRYGSGAAGVKLFLEVPVVVRGVDTRGLGLVRELRHFIDRCLRNNRVVGYVSPVPFLLFGMDAPWWSAPMLLFGGAVIELAYRHAGPSDASDVRWPLVAGAMVATIVTLCFGLGLRGDQAFVCSSATAYPIVELGWRGHWRLWSLFEAIRGLAILPWLFDAGWGGLGGAFILPAALSLIAVGARRLVVRATEVEARVGGLVERRELALLIAESAALRHDVVNRLRGQGTSPAVEGALAELDASIEQLGTSSVAASDPLQDLLEGVAAGCAPSSLDVVYASLDIAGDSASRMSPSMAVERRLANLELGAAVGEQVASLVPPAWNGERRLQGIRADVDRDSAGQVRVQFRAVPKRDRHLRPREASVEFDVARGVSLKPTGEGIGITLGRPVEDFVAH